MHIPSQSRFGVIEHCAAIVRDFGHVAIAAFFGAKMNAMHLFQRIFGTKHAGESVVLIDIGVHAVSGAYAYYKNGEPPLVVYTHRVPIRIRKSENADQAMLRALKTLGADLTREGAPALRRIAGRGDADMILVSVDAPWQETHVRTEHFEEKTPFIFTRSLLAKRMAETNPAHGDTTTLVDESVIGAILNGYETANPYGRKVHRAAIILMSSLIKRTVADKILYVIGGAFHTRDILPISGNSLRYQAARTLFPHEQDAIILDATDRSITSIALVRNGLFVSLQQMEMPSDTETWTKDVSKELSELAQNYPLPRTMFLLARDTEIATLRQALDGARINELWLSDNPPKIVSVLKKHLSGSVRQTPDADPDIAILFMALYYQNRASYASDTLNAH